jgi:thiamine transporter
LKWAFASRVQKCTRVLLFSVQPCALVPLSGGEKESISMWQKFLEGFQNPFSNPDTLPSMLIIAAGLILLTLALFLLRKLKLDTRTLVIAAMCITISFVLSYIRFFTMPQGGSVTPASMLPILLFAWYFGPIPGMAVGLVYGALQFIQDGANFSYGIMEPVFDYLLAFGVLGLAGLFKKHLNIGIIVMVALRYILHVVSGILFFSMYAEDQPVLVYSALYNSFMLPELAICLVIANLPGFKSAITRIFKKPATV